MTQAVCLNCGAMKVGAFTQCPECGYYPKTVEEKAKHLILTDWYFNQEALDGYAQRIKAGKKLEFSPETLSSFVEYVKTGKFPEKKV